MEDRKYFSNLYRKKVTAGSSFILICDTVGNGSKSIVAEFLEYQGLAFAIPMLRQMGDLMEFAHSYRTKQAYLIDMPRGIKTDKIGEFYGGMECRTESHMTRGIVVRSVA